MTPAELRAELLWNEDRARRWAAEVRGLRVGTHEYSAAVQAIADRCYITTDTVRMWIKLVERSEE